MTEVNEIIDDEKYEERPIIKEKKNKPIWFVCGKTCRDHCFVSS